jgi:hypothetical protein
MAIISQIEENVIKLAEEISDRSRATGSRRPAKL